MPPAVIPNQILRWAGDWNVALYYVYCDIVLYTDEKCYVNINSLTQTIGGDPPPTNTDQWLLMPSSAVGTVTSVDSGIGSGLAADPITGDVVLTTNFTAGSNITLTPSEVDTSIQISATVSSAVTSVNSEIGSGITVSPTTGEVSVSSALTAGSNITLTPSAVDTSITINATIPANLCGIYTEATGGSDTAVISAPGLTTEAVVIATYIHASSGGAGQFFRTIQPTIDTITFTCQTNIEVGDQINWFVAKL